MNCTTFGGGCVGIDSAVDFVSKCVFGLYTGRRGGMYLHEAKCIIGTGTAKIERGI